MELRPTGNPPGFLLPPEEIVPTGEENYPAAIFWMRELLKEPLHASSLRESEK